MWFRPGLLLVLSLGSALLSSPLVSVTAQEARKIQRIGYLSPGSIDSHGPLFDVFRRTLRELGYTEGQHFAVEYRWAEGRQDRLGLYATELVQLKVDVILTSGTPATRALKEATGEIPIVFLGVGDPVGVRLVASFAQPGGNITGFSVTSVDIAGKRLELLREALPSLKRVGVLWNAENDSAALAAAEAETAARAFGLTFVPFVVRRPDDLKGVFDHVTMQRVDGLVVMEDPLTFVQRRVIVRSVSERGLPAVYGLKEFVEAGGLMSYSASYVELYRRAAVVVHKILRGASPGELPVERPSKFELVINMKTAKAIGLIIPPSVLLRADQVIE